VSPDNPFEDVFEGLKRRGFSALRPNKRAPMVYFKECEGVAKVFSPHVIVKKEYSRLGGSIGVVVIDAMLNGGLDIRGGMDPVNDAGVYIRIENFPPLSSLGYLDKGGDFDADAFIDELLVIMDEKLPFSIGNLKKMAKEDPSNQILVLMGVATKDSAGRYANAVYAAIADQVPS
jgi:hypothetical protein